MADLEFFFDPVCPWAWITSRWVDEVRSQRDYEVSWKFISLKLLNEGNEGIPPFFVEAQRFGHLGLGEFKKTTQLHQVNTETAVVVPRVAEQPARSAGDGGVEAGRCMRRHEQVGAAGHVPHDQVF